MKNLKALSASIIKQGNENSLKETGIEQLEKVFEVSDLVVQGIKEAKEDGKIDWKDTGIIAKLAIPLVSISASIDVSEIDDELLDIDENEELFIEEKLAKYLEEDGYVDVVVGVLSIGKGLNKIFSKK